MARILFGVVLGILLVPATVLAWFKFGAVPVAVADAPFPMEKQLVGVPLNSRIDHEMIKAVPVTLNEQNLVAGAHVYREECAFCHGYHGHPSVAGAHMYPNAPQLWEKHHNGSVVGVSDDPAGETYWKVAHGIRLTGMPAYEKVLTDTEMWQVSLLLANADKALPPAAIELLQGPGPLAGELGRANGSPSK